MEREVKIGDRIRVLRKPLKWASLLNNRSPLNLKYPYELTVKNIVKDESYQTSLTCGEYGWHLESIIEAGFRFVEDLKVDDKVLWRGFEGVVVSLDGYGGYIVQLEDGDKIITKNVERISPKFVKGEWVKYRYNGETFFTKCKEDNNNPNLTKLENKSLIELLEREL